MNVEENAQHQLEKQMEVLRRVRLGSHDSEKGVLHD